VCRPQDESYRKLSPPTEAPKPPQRSTNQHMQQQAPFLLEQLDPSHDNFSGVSQKSYYKNFIFHFKIHLQKMDYSTVTNEIHL
jgi:hypothetical protein